MMRMCVDLAGPESGKVLPTTAGSTFYEGRKGAAKLRSLEASKPPSESASLTLARVRILP